MGVQPKNIQNSTVANPIRHQWGESFICGYQVANSQGRAWRPQGRKDWLFLFTTAGRGIFRYAGGEYVCAVGDVILISPGTPQDYQSYPQSVRWESIWVHFHPRGHVIPWLHYPEAAAGLGVLQIASAARDLIEADLREMLDVASGPRARDGERTLNVFERVLLRLDTLNPLAEEKEHDPRIRRVLEESGRRLDRIFAIDEMTKIAGMSSSRLHSIFYAEVGLSPAAYHLHARLSRGRELIERTDFPIQQIALELGFSSAFHFSAAFRKYAGKSPPRISARGLRGVAGSGFTPECRWKHGRSESASHKRNRNPRSQRGRDRCSLWTLPREGEFSQERLSTAQLPVVAMAEGVGFEPR